MGAAKYNEKFVWMTQTTTKDVTYGQAKEVFASNGELWGQLEELTANERLAYGATMSSADVKLRLRNIPAVAAIDRLIDRATGETYVIDGINYGANELVVLAHRFRNQP